MENPLSRGGHTHTHTASLLMGSLRNSQPGRLSETCPWRTWLTTRCLLRCASEFLPPTGDRDVGRRDSGEHRGRAENTSPAERWKRAPCSKQAKDLAASPSRTPPVFFGCCQLRCTKEERRQTQSHDLCLCPPPCLCPADEVLVLHGGLPGRADVGRGEDQQKDIGIR